METLTVHVLDDNTATLICPACGATRNVQAEAYRPGRHTMTVRCRCQRTFSILLNFRRHFRKPASLPGTYVIVRPQGGGGGIIQISNISRSGLGFSVSGRHSIKPGQELRIDFQLNDRNKSQIRKQALVRTVDQNTIGCEFTEYSDLDKALGFFLKG